MATGADKNVERLLKGEKSREEKAIAAMLKICTAHKIDCQSCPFVNIYEVKVKDYRHWIPKKERPFAGVACEVIIGFIEKVLEDYGDETIFESSAEVITQDDPEYKNILLLKEPERNDNGESR